MREFAAIVYGAASGGVIATAVFAFIAYIGLIPRLAQKAGAEHHVRILENAVTLGGVTGCVISLFKPTIGIGGPIVGGGLLIGIGLAVGIFYGALVMSLAEVLDVIPILMRRTNIKRALKLVIISIALGKTLGALLYFFLPYFR